MSGLPIPYQEGIPLPHLISVKRHIGAVTRIRTWVVSDETDEEDDDEDLGEPIPLLTDSQMFAIDQSRGLIAREASEHSSREARATTSTANISQVSLTTWGSEAVAESSDSRIKALEEKYAALLAGVLIPPPPPLPPLQPPYGARYTTPIRFMSPPTVRPVTSSPRPEFLQGSIWDTEGGTDRILPSQLPVGTVIRPAASRLPTATVTRPVPTLQLKPDDSWILRQSQNAPPPGQSSGKTGSDTTPPLDLSKGDDDVVQEPAEAMEVDVLESEINVSDEGTTIEVASTVSTATHHTAETGDVSDTTLVTTPTQSDVEVVPEEPPDPPTVILDEESSSPPPVQPVQTEGEGETPPPPEPPDG